MDDFIKFLASCLKNANLSDTNNKQYFIGKSTRLPETIGHKFHDPHQHGKDRPQKPRKGS